MKSGRKSTLVLILVLVTGSLAGIMISEVRAWLAPEPDSREMLITARRYAFDPPKIRVRQGDTLRITLASVDVEHGFFVEGYDIDARILAHQKKFKVRHPSEEEAWKEVDQILLIADRHGKFRYRCSQTCGALHPFMQGELVVEPNTPYYAGIGSMVGLFLGLTWVFFQKTRQESRSESSQVESAEQAV